MKELLNALIKAAERRRDLLKTIHDQTYNSPSDRHAFLIRAQALDDLVMVLIEARGDFKEAAK